MRPLSWSERAARTIKEIAADLGCDRGAVVAGIGFKQQEVDVGKRPGISSDEREELRTRLRRENRVLREEREILKKAAAFFVKESDQTR